MARLLSKTKMVLEIGELHFGSKESMRIKITTMFGIIVIQQRLLLLQIQKSIIHGMMLENSMDHFTTKSCLMRDVKQSLTTRILIAVKKGL